MQKRPLSDQQRRTREQGDRDWERVLLGTQGAASDVRRIDVASVDSAALLAELEAAERKAGKIKGK